MPHASATHRLLVCAFAAWMMLCCCEKQLFAGLFSHDAASATSSCCSNARCHAGEESDDFGVEFGEDADDDAATDDEEKSNHSRKESSCCEGGCCAKFSATIAPFVLAIDVIGAPLAATLLVDRDANTSVHVDVSTHRDSDADPPPRLALIISARLRI